MLHILLALSCCISVCLCSRAHVKELTQPIYNTFSSQPRLQVIHFNKEDKRSDDNDEHEVDSGHDKHAMKIFHKQYARSAAALEPYDIQLYTADCRKVMITEYCTKENVQFNVFILRQGVELLSLGLESMFDEDAIISNILQIALLREVPILQTVKERDEYENRYKGVHDVIFSLQMAIGTREHRLLMEVAYKYHHMYKFAITTEKKTATGLPGIPDGEGSAIWFLQCQERQKASSSRPPKPCSVSRYYGAMSLADLMQFMEDVRVPNLLDVKSAEDILDPFPGTKLGHIIAFHDDDSSKYVREEGINVAKKFRGTAAVLFVNVEHVPTQYDEYLKTHHVPALAYRAQTSDELVFMPEDLEPEAFILKQLGEQVDQSVSLSSRQRLDDEGYESDIEERKYLPEIERQDDDVAMAMSRLRGQPMNDHLLLSLTDKTFPMETKGRDLLLVLFYLPFDAMSSAVHRSFLLASEALSAENMSNPLSAVNCFDWTDVCSMENVSTWPTIRVYRKGHDMKIHKMIASPENILKTVSLYEVAAPVEFTSVEEFQTAIGGNVPRSDLKVNNIAIGLTESDTDSMVIRNLASSLHGEIVVCLATGPVAQQISELFEVPVSSLVVYKMEDIYQNRVVRPLSGVTRDDLMQWTKQATIHVFPELTPLNLPTLYARGEPFVIYFTKLSADTDSTKQTNFILSSMAADGGFPHYIFAWMDMSKDVTQQVMTAYTGDYVQQQLVIVNIIKGQVFVYGGDLLDDISIKTWLSSVAGEEVEPSNLLPKGDWKPKLPPYNFLKMMEDDKKSEKSHELMNNEEIDSDMERSGEDFRYAEDPEFSESPADSTYMSADEFAEYKMRHGIRDEPEAALTDTQVEELRMKIKQHEARRNIEQDSVPSHAKHIEL